MEAKPIFIAKMPEISFDQDRLIEARNTLQDMLKDYHVIVTQTKGEEFVFECFNSNNIEEIDIEELKTKLNL